MRSAAGIAVAVALVACGSPATREPDEQPGVARTFAPADCGGVTDADVTDAVGSALFTRVVVSEAGCFWQESTAIGTLGVGMGISTWWYRGSDLDAERTLERDWGRDLTELSINGNKGFRASDDNACSVYVAKGRDVITWSIQTDDAELLPDLCSVVDALAQLSQDRLN